MNKITQTWSKMRLITRINLIVGFVLALVFAYVAVTAFFGTASQVRYASNDFPGAKKASTAFLTLSPIQRHIGYYNRGTAQAAVGDYEPAQDDLESALDITPVSDECAVRINLSYVYEQRADLVTDQDAKQSDELYEQSLQTLDDAPEECQPKKSEEKQKSEEAKKRVEDKKEGAKAKQEGSEGDDPDSDDQESDDSGEDSKDKDEGQDSEPGDDQSDDSGNKSEEEKKREELKKRGEESERQQRQQGPGGEGGRSTPEKPW